MLRHPSEEKQKLNDFLQLFTIIEGRGKTDYWTAPDGMEPEVPKEINMKRLMKKHQKGKNETIRKEYKYKKETAAKH